MPTRLVPACLTALLLACGSKFPDSGVTDSTSAASGTAETTTTTAETTTTTAETTTTTVSTTDVAVTMSDTDPTTVTSGTTDPTTSDTDPSTVTSGTTDPTTSGENTTMGGACIADPASGTCTEACDWWSDCCKCDGQEFFPDPMAVDCALAMGIVTEVCPWDVWRLSWDNEWVSRVFSADECAVTEWGWYQDWENGDIIIHLCGQACIDYLAGDFTMIEGQMFCEAA